MIPRLLADLRDRGTHVELTADGTDYEIHGRPPSDEDRAALERHRDLVVRILKLDEGATTGFALGRRARLCATWGCSRVTSGVYCAACRDDSDDGPNAA